MVVPSSLPSVAVPPRPFGETRKKCVSFILNGSRAGEGGREGHGAAADRPPSELIPAPRRRRRRRRRCCYPFVVPFALRFVSEFPFPSSAAAAACSPIRQAAAEKQRFDRSDLKGERKRERKERRRGRDVGRGRWGKRARRGGEGEGGWDRKEAKKITKMAARKPMLAVPFEPEEMGESASASPCHRHQAQVATLATATFLVFPAIPTRTIACFF